MLAGSQFVPRRMKRSLFEYGDINDVVGHSRPFADRSGTRRGSDDFRVCKNQRSITGFAHVEDDDSLRYVDLDGGKSDAF